MKLFKIQNLTLFYVLSCSLIFLILQYHLVIQFSSNSSLLRSFLHGSLGNCDSHWRYLARQSQGGLSCIGNSPDDGQFCVANRVCVNRSHGLWISVSNKHSTYSHNTPEIVMMGVDLNTDQIRKSFPVRRERFQQQDLPSLVVGSFYECGHMSHFFLNGAFPAAASAMRLTSNGRRPTLIAERIHGQCNIDTFSTLGSVFSNDFSREDIMRLDQPESLPKETQCFGTTLLGLRRTCFHNYCPRLIERSDVDYFSKAVKNHFQIGLDSGKRKSLHVTFIQRRESRVILNLGLVVESLQKLADEAVMYTCNGVNTTLTEPFSWMSDPFVHVYLCGIKNLIHTKVVELEDLPYKDQIQLFADTDVLVAAHGNAIGNSVWMPNHGAVVECFMKGWWSPWFMEPVKNILRLDYTALTSERTVLTAEQEALEKEAKGKGEEEGLLKRRNLLLNADESARNMFLAIGRVFKLKSQQRESVFDGSQKVIDCS
jgi:hypothetical protein